ncbi:MAG: sortase [Actinomycetota bacterium]|jgi:sortase A|nr:sortase [Actinomycetota bacterium]
MRGVRAVVRGIGELFITAGLVLLLFCAYQLVWTNVEANREQSQVSKSLSQRWSDPQAQAGSQLHLTTADFGKGFAFIHIPRLGKNFTKPIVEGVRKSDLARGVGHYPKTALPGEVGNFAVAGHRATHGEPFRNLNQMRKGDKVVVETKDTWFTYIVDRTLIVNPSDVWVIDPVPGKKNVAPTQKLLTLTTCNPRWASTQRLIVFTHLLTQQPKTAGPPAALITAAG